MTPAQGWIKLARRLLRPAERQWLDAALAELPHIDEHDRGRWRAGIWSYIARGCLSRLATTTATIGALAITAFGIGLLDLNIEPTSVSLGLILLAGAFGGYMLQRSWWLVGLIVGSSISLTAWIVLAFDLHPSGRPAETSAASMLALLVLTIPATLASRGGVAVRRRSEMAPGGGSLDGPQAHT